MAKRRRERRDELTTDEYWELLIGHGDTGGSVFESPFIKRASWEHHREELLAVCTEGIRPDAFWQFEHPAMHDAGTGERLEYLRERSLLEGWEEAKLKTQEAMREEEHGDRDSTLIN